MTTPSRTPATRPPPRRLAWSSGDVLRVAAIVAGLYLALQFLWVGRSVFLISFLAILLGLCLSAGADYLARWRIPRAVGAILLMLAAIGALVGLGMLAAPRIADQMRDLRDELPAAVQRIEHWVDARYGGLVQMVRPSPDSTGQAGAASRSPGQDSTRVAAPSGDVVRRGLSQQVAGLGTHFFAIFSSTLAVLGGLILIVFVAIYITVDPELYHRGLLQLFPPRRRPRASEVLHQLATTLRRWLVSQFIAMLVIGTVTTGVLLLIGVRAAVALGIIAGLLEFVPYVGPILSAIPAIAMAFLTSPSMALYVVVAYTVIQQAENHLLIPLLMKRGVDLPPVVTIISQAVMGLVFGFLGLLVAVPLASAAMVIVKMLYVQDVVGEKRP
jgi:predicted PurR-regulated permease PerM